jgi:hypothetical protein
MLSSISPLGERARASRWWLTTASYLIASTAGGLLTGSVAAAAGSLLPERVRSAPAAPVVLAAAMLAGFVLDHRARGGAVPSWRRQVDESWLDRYRGWVYGAGFGIQLGAGLVTIVTSTTTYAAVLLAAWSGRLATGALIGAGFGLVRALPLLLLKGVAEPARLRGRFEALEALRAPAALLAKVGLIAAAAALLASHQGV